MPVYQRVCRDCGARFERFVRASQLSAIRCDCGSADHDIDVAQLRSVSTHSNELHGTRRRLWDVVVNPQEVGEVRREFAGVPATVTDDGKVYIDTKEDRAKWHAREREIHERAQVEHAANDEREKRGEPIKQVVTPLKKRNRVIKQT